VDKMHAKERLGDTVFSLNFNYTSIFHDHDDNGEVISHLGRIALKSH